MDGHRERIEDPGARQRAAIDVEMVGDIAAVKNDRAGIDVDLIDAREIVGVDEAVARAGREIDGVARTGADDAAVDGAARNVEHVGVGREPDRAVDGAAGLIDRDRACRPMEIDRHRRPSDRARVHERAARGEGYAAAETDGAHSGDRAGIADIAGEACDRAEENAGLVRSDRAAIGDAAAELPNIEDVHTGEARDRPAAAVRDATREGRCADLDAGPRGGGDGAGVADSAAELADAVDRNACLTARARRDRAAVAYAAGECGDASDGDATVGRREIMPPFEMPPVKATTLVRVMTEPPLKSCRY